MPHKFFAGFFIILGTAVLLYLGQWQLDRLGWKQSILKDIESKISGTPQYLPDSINEIEHKYLPVEVSGKLDDNFIKIMVSQKFIGAGYRIIVPFELEVCALSIESKNFSIIIQELLLGWNTSTSEFLFEEFQKLWILLWWNWFLRTYKSIIWA